MQPGYPQQPYEQLYEQPGHPQDPAPQSPINNNMTMSIASIFLFWPLAIAAILNAAKVNPALQIGDFATAQVAAAESRKYSRLAIIVGVCCYVILLLCCALLVNQILTTLEMKSS